MSLVGSQQQTLLRLLAAIRPHWHQDAGLPARVQALLSGNRSFGSRDRRLYRELIYTALRYLPWIEALLSQGRPTEAIQLTAWLASDIPAVHAFRAASTEGWPPCPPTLAAKVQLARNQLASVGVSPGDFPSVLPEWFQAHCPAVFAPEQTDALLARAPLWLRLQTDDETRVFAEWEARGWAWERSPALPTAIEMKTETNLTQSEAYQAGLIEVQDLGSQMILASIGIEPGAHWLDACAGAGGKTLQLARFLGPFGQVDAYDIRPKALSELKLRAARAGLTRLAILTAPPSGLYDAVLVDAPCSGSGTWRRAPHLKWTTSPEQISQASHRQHELLSTFSERVRPGGRLVYGTCSLSRQENEDVVSRFLEGHPQFSPVAFRHTFGFGPGPLGMTLLPARHDTDGFFVASLRRA